MQFFQNLTVLFPGIEPICEELKIRQICLDDVAKKANAELMPFEFENREEQSSIIIDKIIESYKERRGSVALHLMEEHGNDHTLTGVSEGSLKILPGRKVDAANRTAGIRRDQRSCRCGGMLQPDCRRT